MVVPEKTRGPQEGYLSESKRQYRKNVWNNINNGFGGNMGDKKVLIFPSNHDAEIKQVLKSGVKEENIWACDESAALLATAKWRKVYPKINILGVKLERAIVKLNSAGIKIDAANFDFCSNLCGSVFVDVANFVNMVGSDVFCFGVTLLKGREGALETLLAKMLYTDIKGAADRVKVLVHFVVSKCKVRIRNIFQSEYKSGKQYMTYGVHKSIKISKIEADCSKVFVKYASSVRRVMAIDKAFYKADNTYSHEINMIPIIGPSKKKAAIYNKKVAVKKKLLKKFWKENNKLRKLMDDEWYSIEGYSDRRGEEYIGEQPGIMLFGSKEREIYRELLNMPYHRV